MRTDDGRIVQECLNGESTAFGILVDRYKAGIYAFVYDKLRNFHDAQDVTQEVFLQAYCNLRSLRRWESFGFWLYRIARNQCGKWIRTQSRRLDRKFIEDQDSESLESSSLKSYRDSQLNESLREALDSLPESYREALILQYFGGMNSSEIARVIGVSPTAIRMRLSRARAQLKEEMTAMVDTAFEGQRLQATFTFRIVEAVRRIKIHPMPRITGLPWGLSLTAGIICAILNFNPRLNVFNPMDAHVESALPGRAKALKTGEIPVDILKVSQTPSSTNVQDDSDVTLARMTQARAASGEGQIIFARNYNIWIMDEDGGKENQLTAVPTDDGAPVWSPDGKQIAFFRYTNDVDYRDIFIMNADGTNVRRITRGPENDNFSTWSPDGRQIAFERSTWEQGPDGKWERLTCGIYVTDTDGANVRCLIEDQTNPQYPRWSPDGKRIAYWCWPVDRPSLWVIDTNGENRRMVHRWGGNYGIDWSPGGEKIVFCSYQDKPWTANDIYVINADGKGMRRLTQPGPAMYYYPVWSPDGKRIAFCSDKDGNVNKNDVYIMDADGSNVQRITNTPTTNEFWIDWWGGPPYAVKSASRLKAKWGQIKAPMP